MSDETGNKSTKRRDGHPKAELPLEKAGTVTVTFTAVPPKGPPDKQIHPRRKLPEVPPSQPGKQER
jgi:hypothetical protein